jgi:glycosyltransferase involved in cell wall biosynthesis
MINISTSPVEAPPGICILIPTYNNAGTLEGVIRGVLEHSPHVIVINDGSTDNTREITAKFNEIDAIHLPKNKGKGFAIRTGLKEALRRGFEYAITIDSDGQHLPSDLPKFFQKIEEEPDTLIIGARNMEQAGIPGGSTFGNKFSNFWTWVETGYSLPDTQSGYRLYPVKLLAKTRWFTRRFEFEIEVIIRSAWKGIPITSVPVSVIYPPKEERVSHFRPFTDFARISVLNTVLTLLALLFFRPMMLYRRVRQENFRDLMRRLLLTPGESNFKKAASVGIGVFMGILPIWGWQMAVALGVAVLLRLNKTITLIASNISIPPMIPLIIFGSYLTGGLVLDIKKDISYSSMLSFETVKDNLLQYVVGAVVFGLAMGILAGLLSWLLLAIFRRQHKVKPPEGEEDF